jgi:hypothetical protein
MDILVATLHFGEIPYASYTKAANSSYCERHGYKFVVIRPYDQTERHPIWFKVKGVGDLLPSTEYLLFIDADAYFIDHEQSIESLIERHMREATFLIGNDRRDATYAYNDEKANTGVFVVRNRPKAFEILHDWWDVPQHCDPKSLWLWPIEQDAFNTYIRTGRHAHDIRMIHYQYLNGRDGTFIRHLMGYSDEERLRKLRGIHLGQNR